MVPFQQGDREIARFRRADNILEQSLAQLHQMEAEVRGFFATSGVDEFVPHYMYVERHSGAYWKEMEDWTGVPLDADTLIEEGWEIFPKALALLEYNERYRGRQII